MAINWLTEKCALKWVLCEMHPIPSHLSLKQKNPMHGRYPWFALDIIIWRTLASCRIFNSTRHWSNYLTPCNLIGFHPILSYPGPILLSKCELMPNCFQRYECNAMRMLVEYVEYFYKLVASPWIPMWHTIRNNVIFHLTFLFSIEQFTYSTRCV